MSNILPAWAGSKRPPINIESSVELRLRGLAPRVHALGEAPLFHLLRELVAGADLVGTLETYARLSPDLIRAYGGDKLPPALTLISGSSL
jgi:hypothetical protein